MVEGNAEGKYYLPHQAVIKDTSLTTKLLLLNVDPLRAVKTSGPTDTKHVLVTSGPIFISGKYGSRGGT